MVQVFDKVNAEPDVADVDEKSPPRRTLKLAWILGGLLTLALALTAAQWLLASRVPPHTSVLGIQIGGLRHDAAIAAITEGLGMRNQQPIALTAGGSTTTLDPINAGLSVDTVGTVGKLTGFTMNPLRLWEHIFGHGNENPVISVNQEQLTAAAETAANRLRLSPVNGRVSIVDGDAVATAARYGQEVPAATIAAQLPERWLVESGPLEFEAQQIEPEITQAATDAALAQAQAIVAGPVNVNVGGQTVALTGSEIGAATTFVAANGALTPELDGEALVDLIIAGTNNLITKPVDAHFNFVEGRPGIVDGSDGTTVEPDAAASAIATAALGGGTRTATLQLSDKGPALTRADLEALGVNEVVASFATPITNDSIRTGNLVRGAQLVTGTLVMPDEIFSLTDTLSPIDASNGFANAGVIVGGVHTEGMGGGLSQMATTTFNAGYFAGFEDIEHRPHSVFITRYPAGREATLAIGSLDMRFRNTTPYGAVMQAWVSGGELHVQIWSTPYFRVETSASSRSNERAATTVEQSGANCVPQAAGQPGFTITNNRQVFRLDNNEKVEDLSGSFTWTYQPDNGISCWSPPVVQQPDWGGDADDWFGGGW